MYDLPSEELEEPGLPDQFHIYQPRLLEETFRPPSHPTNKVFVATDLNLYYDPLDTPQPKGVGILASTGESRKHGTKSRYFPRSQNKGRGLRPMIFGSHSLVQTP
ncbi:MAG: hypothetical protein BRC52_03800 [Cyanobacteria bacterium SW_5_48_44]|nr:MAG: hypothetical protein BRC52_03800 [Cyanobacteria bacterium SW_5_48_44]